MLDKKRLQNDIERLLGEEGLLSRRIDGFKHRPGQLSMARLAADAICEQLPLLAEGGTGIGKTLAYLVPAILSGRKTVVSTGTKTLQEQVFYKDIPILLDAVDLPIKVSYMKGRANYLCKLRYEQFSQQRLFRFAAEASMYDEIEQWAAITETGDRSELTSLPDDYAAWSELTSTSDSCLGSRCRHYKDCYITKMRKRAQEADLVIVNHHLYFADIAVREGDFGEVIPNHEIVIFDEAHLLESVATQYFGVGVSNGRAYSLSDDIIRWINANALNGRGIAKVVREMKECAAAFFELLAEYDGRYRLAGQILEDEELQQRRYTLDDRLDILRRMLANLEEEHEEATGLGLRVRKLADDLATVMDAELEDYVFWGETRRRSIALNASPLNIAPLMRERFFSRRVQSILTSATLSTNLSFDYFKKRLGVPEDCREAIFPSPFNYRHNTLFYVPRRMPEPNHRNFTAATADTVERLLELTQGGALVLFTSYANMDAVYDKLVGRLPYTLLRQGDAPRSQLLERFRESFNSVLLATGTFWQGVDILGQSLRMLIIDKLPFEAPGDPITEARIRYMKEQGSNAFFDYQVPTAIIQLKQGVGRLIRDHDDWGIIALLDRRVVTKNYGRHFLSSLPPSRRADKMEDVSRWWKRKAAMAEDLEDKLH